MLFAGRRRRRRSGRRSAELPAASAADAMRAPARRARAAARRAGGRGRGDRGRPRRLRRHARRRASPASPPSSTARCSTRPRPASRSTRWATRRSWPPPPARSSTGSRLRTAAAAGRGRAGPRLRLRPGRGARWRRAAGRCWGWTSPPAWSPRPRRRHGGAAQRAVRADRRARTSTGWQPAAFDLVLAIDSFPYIVQTGAAMAVRHVADAARVLRPGGALCILNLSYRNDAGAGPGRRAAVGRSATALRLGRWPSRGRSGCGTATAYVLRAVIRRPAGLLLALLLALLRRWPATAQERPRRNAAAAGRAARPARSIRRSTTPRSIWQVFCPSL